jgi:ferredoxin-NADP reductase
MTVIGRPLPERQLFPAGSLPPVKRSRPHGVPNATLVAREEITATLGVFVVIVDNPMAALRAGQYVSLGIEIGNELVQRPYSVVSCTFDRSRLEFFVRRLPDGRFSNLLWSLSVGDRIFVGPPKGLFTLDREERRPRVMIGTGTGVAPLVAMLDLANQNRDLVPTVLIHGASFADELAFGDRIQAWIRRGSPIDYRPTVSRPTEKRNRDWTGRTGRVDAQLCALLEEWRWLRAGGSVAYLCGSPEMVSDCSRRLLDTGFASTDIHVELFHAPGSGQQRDIQGGTANA